MFEMFSSVSEKLLKQEDPKSKTAKLKKQQEEILKKQKAIYEEYILLEKLTEHLDKREHEHKQNTKIAKTHKSELEKIRKVLQITDRLLEKLPNEEILKFVKSKDFTLYKEVVSKYLENK